MAKIYDSNKIIGDGKVAEHLMEWKEELKGITDPIKRQNTAQVLANISATAEREFESLQESWNIGTGNTGLNAPYGSFGQGPTTIYPAGQFAPQVVAMTRRTLPYLIAADIFGTQALSGPVGVGFGFKYRRFVQGGDLTNAAGDSVPPAIGTTMNSRGQQLMGGGTVTGPGGISYKLAPINYGAGAGSAEKTANNVAYTSNGQDFVYADGPFKGQKVPNGTALFPEAGWQEVPDYVGFSGAMKGKKDVPFKVTNKARDNTGFNFGKDVPVDTLTESSWGQPVGADDLITRGPSSSSEGWGITKDWNSIDAEGSGDFKMPELGFDLTEIIFRTGDRQLAASISNKTKAYLKSMHGLEAEKEMWNMLDFLVKLEKDREALLRARALAYKTGCVKNPDGSYTQIVPGSRSYQDLSFNRGPGYYGSESAYFTYTLDCSTVKGRWAQEVFAIIPFMILKAAQDIRVRNLRAPGNFCIVSPKVATILNVSGEIFAGFKTNVNGSVVTPEIGTLNGNIKVYCDNFAKDDVILVGYKGPGVADAAAIYTPYIDSLELRATDPTDFAQRIGVTSTYGYTENLLNGDIYLSTIALKNVDQMFIIAEASGGTTPAGG